MNTLINKLTVATLLLLVSITANADDIDIINSERLVDANVLFVMDLSGSMNWKLDDDKEAKGAADGDPSRLEVLRGAFQSITADPKYQDSNFGLSMFSGDAQSGIAKGKARGMVFPVSRVNGDDAQTVLSKPVEGLNPAFVHPGTAPDDSYMPAAGSLNTPGYLSLLSSNTTIWDAGGSTPIVDALFEATRYFRGESVYWGRHIASDVRAAHPTTYTGDLALTTSTITPACTTGNRLSCAKGSCGITEACEVNLVSSTRSDPTGGTNCTTNTANTCLTSSASCGLGTNCVSEINTYNRYCASSISTTTACEAANPTWNSCQTYDSTSCTTNDENQSVCTTSTRVRCEETVTQNRCDAANTYTCDFPLESCTKCPGETITPVVTGPAVYKSPITQSCQSNAIILLSDGAATQNDSASLITTMIGSTYANGCDTGSSDERCGPELAEFLAKVDHADGSTSVPNLSNVPDIQKVNTYTVGLSLDAGSTAENYLKLIAQKGEGAYVAAADEAGLVAAFAKALEGIAGKARSFASPSYSVDTSTLLTHGDSVYIPIFDRSGTLWPGNLKKFNLVNGVLTDKNNVAAVNASGELLKVAKDLWATTDSDDLIRSGGAANMIPDPDSRNVFTDNDQLGTLANLQTLNDSVSKTLLGNAGMSDSLRSDLIDFIKGENPDGTTRHHMGDIIHSKPVQLVKDNAGTKEKFIFVGTNEGYLHAINDADGSEEFAFMPSELLKNIEKQFTNVASPNHIYGVDGAITLWLDESASTGDMVGNGVLDSGENAYLFFGLRRGGKSYYALKVTDPANPELVWKKSLGSGDSWSQPVIASLKWGTNASPKSVIVIGGGYSEDPVTGIEKPTPLLEGNAVYIQEALTGADVWHTEKNLLTSGKIEGAVPSRIRVIDVDRNGLADKLYFGDTKGDLWRVDLNAGDFSNTASDHGNIDLAELHKLADLSDGSGKDARKFFEEPDVAIFKKGGKLVASVSVGSGDRTKPLDNSIEDMFFMVYDKEILILPTAATVKWDKLKTTPVSVSDSDKSDFKGWRKTLNKANGEKVLSTAITYQNKVLFTTFQATSNVPDPCNPSNENEARLYIMDLFLGGVDYNQKAASGEILATPQIVFDEFKATDGVSACTKDDCERTVAVRVGRVGPIPLPALPAGVVAPEALPRVYWLKDEKQ